MKISVVRIHARSKHGLALADELGVTAMAKERGWHRVWSPFVLFVNPHTGVMHSESYWEAESGYCEYGAVFAASIEGIGMSPKGTHHQTREICSYSDE
jgi:hypothetical protein